MAVAPRRAQSCRVMVQGSTDILCLPPKSHMAPPEAFSPVPIASNPLTNWIFFFFNEREQSKEQDRVCELNMEKIYPWW